MTSDGKDPPQPLTDVKNAAISFLDQLKNTDRAGLLSFATNVSDPIDAVLTLNYAHLKEEIQSIVIDSHGTQYTNLGEAILDASMELNATTSNPLSNKIIVLLTDGIPTYPLLMKGDSDYPSMYALAQAAEAKARGDELYVIGLGKDVNKTLLQKIASTPDYYFPAASSAALNSIYKKIAVAICQNGPTVVEVIPRIIPQ